MERNTEKPLEFIVLEALKEAIRKLKLEQSVQEQVNKK